jgi:hypothetical protein
MDYEKLYESWRRQRAEADVPPDFADRVMLSLRRTRLQFWLRLWRKMRATAAGSKLLRTAIYSLAIAIWLMRLGALFAIFIT